MPTGAVSSLIDALRDADLLEPEQLDALTSDFQASFSDPQALAQDLILRGWVSGYQAEKLLQGHGQDLIVGPYRLVELLGEGNMGQVFKAWHQRLNRIVALKLIRPERLSKDSDSVSRFQREARAAAQLLHPNVIIIYDADQIGDRHFIAMEYVDGIDLSKLVKQIGPLPVAEACDYIRQAAEGLQHACECGLVHRDIKPSNLLVTRSSKRTPILNMPGGSRGPEVVGDATTGSHPFRGGVVKILDMGLARLVPLTEARKGDGSLTEEGQMMGTPDYIAPEQARNARSVDIRADLYSLGCTFYYLVTGRPPFPEGSTIEKLLMHQLNQPPPIRDLRPSVPREVIAVVNRLMAKEPADRYQKPADVVAVLTELASKSSANAVAEAPPTRTERSPEKHEQQERTELSSPEPMQAPSQRRHAGSESMRVDRIAVLKGHRGCVLAVAIAPSTEFLATGGVDGTVRLWDLSAHPPRQCASLEPVQGEVQLLLFSGDSRMLAASDGRVVALWNLSGPQPEQMAVLRGAHDAVRALAFARDSQTVATAGDHTVCLWDLTGPSVKKRALLRGHPKNVTAVAFGPDGTQPASGGDDGTICLWDTNRLFFKMALRFQAHLNQINTLCFSPDGTTLASGGLNQTVVLWDVTGPRPALRTNLEGHDNVIRWVRFSADGQSILSISDGGQVIRWDASTSRRLLEWRLPQKIALSFDCTLDGRFLITGDNDGSVCIYQLRTPADDSVG
jgi:serine/threonine-protein kinase